MKILFLTILIMGASQATFAREGHERILFESRQQQVMAEPNLVNYQSNAKTETVTPVDKQGSNTCSCC